MYAPWITQRCLTWSALSLGLCLCSHCPLPLEFHLFLPSPRLSVQQPSLTFPHLPARWPLVPLTKPITHAGPLMTRGRAGYFVGCGPLKCRNHILLPCFSGCPHGRSPGLEQNWLKYTSLEGGNE